MKTYEPERSFQKAATAKCAPNLDNRPEPGRADDRLSCSGVNHFSPPVLVAWESTRMKTYIEISFADDTTCVCASEDVADMTEGSKGYTTKEVKMTEAEFNTLPEFEA